MVNQPALQGKKGWTQTLAMLDPLLSWTWIAAVSQQQPLSVPRGDQRAYDGGEEAAAVAETVAVAVIVAVVAAAAAGGDSGAAAAAAAAAAAVEHDAVVEDDAAVSPVVLAALAAVALRQLRHFQREAAQAYDAVHAAVEVGFAWLYGTQSECLALNLYEEVSKVVGCAGSEKGAGVDSFDYSVVVEERHAGEDDRFQRPQISHRQDWDAEKIAMHTADVDDAMYAAAAVAVAAAAAVVVVAAAVDAAAAVVAAIVAAAVDAAVVVVAAAAGALSHGVNLQGMGPGMALDSDVGTHGVNQAQALQMYAIYIPHGIHGLTLKAVSSLKTLMHSHEEMGLGPASVQNSCVHNEKSLQAAIEVAYPWLTPRRYA
ncbi:hypothetical protein BGZ58_009929 [Dissophora ornata]|nr:hypothetical protein BGZ58_009929 [Dissophora ornata]